MIIDHNVKTLINTVESLLAPTWILVKGSGENGMTNYIMFVFLFFSIFLAPFFSSSKLTQLEVCLSICNNQHLRSAGKVYFC